MLEFLTNNIEFVLFIAFLAIFLYIKRKNVEIQGSFPFLYMILYKTTWGIEWMKKLAKKFPTTFLYLAKLSWFIGVFGAVFSLIFMVWQLGFIIDNNIEAGGGLVLPLKTEDGMNSAVPVFYVPFWYWLIALFILAFVHEFAHGVIAKRFKIKIKSSGFAFLGIFAPIMPAAFVEPDQKAMDKAKRWHKVAVLGAGSTSNFIFGILFLLILIFVANPLTNATQEINSISFYSTMNQSNLKDYNITSGEILSFNSKIEKDEIFLSMQNSSPNSTYQITVLDQNNKTQNINLTTFENENNPNKGMIGIYLNPIEYKTVEEYSYLGNFPQYFSMLMFWIAFLNIGIGIMNLLPIWITDGGQIAKTYLDKYFEEKMALHLYNFISLVCLVLILFTLKPQWLFSLLGLN